MKLYLAVALLVAQAVAPQPPAPTGSIPQNVSPPVPRNASPTVPRNASPSGPRNASPGAPQNGSPAGPLVEPTPDPASSHFLTEVGLLLVAIKAPAVPDYELIMQTLQEALAKDTDPIRSAAAAGWRVYKSTELDAKGSQLYVHMMLPTVTGFDYRPSLLLDELIDDLSFELLASYQNAFAGPPTKLSLTQFAHMAVAPVAANATPGAPANVSPPAPANITPPVIAPATPPAPKKPPGRR